MKKLLLIGGGGHARACIDVIRQTSEYELIGILDASEKIDENVDEVAIVGSDKDIDEWLKKTDECLIAVGHIGRTNRRQELHKQLKEKGAKFATVISPRAYCAGTAQIGEGTIIMHDVLINAGAKVAENCIINSKALIEHDAAVGAHTHISTRASVNGSAQVGSNCFIGSHAVIFNNCSVGDSSVVGGGQVVMQDLPDDSMPSAISSK